MSEDVDQAETINQHHVQTVSGAENIYSTIPSTTPTTSLLSETKTDQQDGKTGSPAKPNFWTRMKNLWSDTWILEIIALSICWTFGSAIWVILGVFNTTSFLAQRVNDKYHYCRFLNCEQVVTVARSVKLYQPVEMEVVPTNSKAQPHAIV